MIVYWKEISRRAGIQDEHSIGIVIEADAVHTGGDL